MSLKDELTEEMYGTGEGEVLPLNPGWICLYEGNVVKFRTNGRHEYAKNSSNLYSASRLIAQSINFQRQEQTEEYVRWGGMICPCPRTLAEKAVW